MLKCNNGTFDLPVLWASERDLFAPSTLFTYIPEERNIPPDKKSLIKKTACLGNCAGFFLA
jgi:hypothetical protein